MMRRRMLNVYESSVSASRAGMALGGALLACCLLAAPLRADEHQGSIDPQVIEKATGTEATQKPGGVVRIGWVRDEVDVTVDNAPFPPAAGLGSWAAFKPTGEGQAMVMGDTVVFRDEVDAAMDAAFANGLAITALHNHFFYDEPKVYFMHIGGRGEPQELAEGVKAVWDAIKQVRSERPQPAESFGGLKPEPGELNVEQIEKITELEASEKPGGVVKVSQGREGRMLGMKIGGSMGLGTWAAFSGSDEAASIDGDFIMAAGEVQPVLRTLRDHGIHVVALHNHMIAEEPPFYFTHYWGTGEAAELAEAFRAALDAQAEAREEEAQEEHEDRG